MQEPDVRAAGVKHQPHADGLILKPEAGAWRRASETWTELSAQASRFREQLGLPTDRPIVMSGHQAEIWHPGILAKYLAMMEAAERFGAHAAWLVVDSDAHDPFDVRFPIREERGDSTRLEVATWRVSQTPPARGVPAARLPGVRPAGLPTQATSAAASSVRAGLDAIRAELDAHSHAANAAEQFGAAALVLAERARTHASVNVQGHPAQLVMATAVSHTEAFARVVDLARSNPGALRDKYNHAAALHPEARIAPLAAGELPLWEIAGGMGSQRVTATDESVKSREMTELAPKALLLTGMMRWLACDLFIHGTGGAGVTGEGGYDQVTSAWLQEWLGATLAPMVMATATLRLKLNVSVPAINEIDRATWLAHAALHHPRLIGDSHADAARERALAAVRSFAGRVDPESKAAKLNAYREMHRELATWRTEREAELGRLAENAKEAAEWQTQAQIASDRTWAFPMYERAQLSGLAQEVRAAFAGA